MPGAQRGPRRGTPIQYPDAVGDHDEQRLVSDAEIAEVACTAFTGQQITGRLLVRRVKRLNPNTKTQPDKAMTAQQQELFAAYRYHAVFTYSPLTLIQAEKTHREHAIIEQVIADVKQRPLAHLPSGTFTANSAWLVLAAMAVNLTRAAGCLGSSSHARATTGTIRVGAPPRPATP